MQLSHARAGTGCGKELKEEAMLVEQLMTRDVKTCGPDESLAEAARLMWDNDLGCVPVVDEDDTLTGIITDRDVSMAAYARDQALSQINVGEVMTRNLATCRSDQSHMVASALMRNKQIRRLPIVDAHEHVVGIVSLNDLARHSRVSNPEVEDGVSPADISNTLAAICESSTTTHERALL
jgi:CBS domain-containing protein